MSTATDQPMDKKVIQSVFEERVRRFGPRLAVEDSHGSLTYQQLNQQANQIAWMLLEAGLQPHQHVGLALRSSGQYVSALLGVCKAGGVFVPMAPDLPVERFNALMEQVTPAILLVEEDSLDAVCTSLGTHAEHTEIYCVAHDQNHWHMASGTDFPLATDLLPNPEQRSHGDSPCYIMTTSGSTGRPKAILGQHKGLSHFIHWEIGEFSLDEHIRGCLLAPPGFDVSLRDILIPLFCGGTLCIPAPAERDTPAHLAHWLRSTCISLCHMVPSLFRLLCQALETHDDSALEDSPLPDLKYLLLAGEPVYGRDVERWRRLAGSKTELINLYGPSETTLAKLFHRIAAQEQIPENQIVPLGQPIGNTAALILRQGRLCAPGEIGEIHIKTPFRTLGYYNDPDLTAAHFIQNPLETDHQDILYKTGDMGRYSPEYHVSFAGRQDRQVKINGVRIELDEIEGSLNAHPAIEQALVIPQKNARQEQVLVSYFTSRQPVDSREMRSFLQRSLPASMIPAYFVHLESFPLNINGKIDRRNLPRPQELVLGDLPYSPPQTEEQRQVIQIWEDILGIAPIGIDHAFTDIGGTSLRAIRLASQITRQMGVEVPLQAIFQYPTIRDLCALLFENSQSNAPAPCLRSTSEPIPAAPDTRNDPLSRGQRRLWIMDRIGGASSFAYQPFDAIEIQGQLDPSRLRQAFIRLIERHQILRTGFVLSGDEPRQYVRPLANCDWAEQDWSRRENAEQDALAEAHRMMQRRFDLEQDPLVRLQLFRLGAERWWLLLAMHHIVVDGWSLDILEKELMELYLDPQGAQLPDLPIQYRDYAHWQHEWLQTDEAGQHRTYWHRLLAPPLADSSLPGIRPRPDHPDLHGGIRRYQIAYDQFQMLSRISSSSGATPFMGTLSLLSLLVHQYSGTTDVRFGVPVAGRQHPDIEPLIGFFVNTLVLRLPVQTERNFDQHMRSLAQLSTEAYEHQAYPFDCLVDELQPQPERNRAPFFDIMIVWQNNETGSFDPPGLQLRQLEIDRPYSAHELIFEFIPGDMQLDVHIRYTNAIYDPSTIDSFFEHFKRLLTHCLQHPDAPLDQAPKPDRIPRAHDCDTAPPPATQRIRSTGVLEQLKTCLQDVLKRDDIDWNRSFFALGGDSIRAIQLASRLRRSGYDLEVARIFSARSLMELAATLEPTRDISTPTVTTAGPIALGPIQRRYFRALERQPELKNHRFNQAILLCPSEHLASDTLIASLEQLVYRHPMLRAQFQHSPESTVQTILPTQEFELPFSRHELTSIQDITPLCDQLQADIDISQGPLVRIALLELPDASQRLFMAMHHLVVDAVSWNVLIEDLLHIMSTQNPEHLLPVRATGYGQWTQALLDTLPQARQQAAYWSSMLQHFPHNDKPCASKPRYADRQFLSWKLDPESTACMTERTYAVYRTDLNAILLSALARALHRWNGSSHNLIALEGHGRESLPGTALETCDVAQTTGWFTALFPFEIESLENPHQCIRQTIHRLEQLPGRGLYYGMLCFLDNQYQELEQLQPPVLFNFLGTQDIPEHLGWTLAQEELGHGVDPQWPDDFDMDLESMIQDGQYCLELGFQPSRVRPQQAQAFLEHYEQSLRECIEHCRTSMNHFDADLDDDDIDDILGGLE